MLGNRHLSHTVLGLGIVRVWKYIQPLKFKGQVLGFCILYDTFVLPVVLLFCPTLKMFYG